MADCRYFPECQRCNETGDSWLPCAGGHDGTRCHGYEPMPDVDALAKLADEMEAWALTCDHYDRRVSPIEVTRYARRIREALGVES